MKLENPSLTSVTAELMAGRAVEVEAVGGPPHRSSCIGGDCGMDEDLKARQELLLLLAQLIPTDRPVDLMIEWTVKPGGTIVLNALLDNPMPPNVMRQWKVM